MLFLNTKSNLLLWHCSFLCAFSPIHPSLPLHKLYVTPENDYKEEKCVTELLEFIKKLPDDDVKIKNAIDNDAPYKHFLYEISADKKALLKMIKKCKNPQKITLSSI